MTNEKDVHDRYYSEVGTFIDLVCQRNVSFAKTILVATKADGKRGQPSNEVLALILQRAKSHISYIVGSDSEPFVALFDEILVTSSKDVSSAKGQDMLNKLHKVLAAMVTKVKPLSKIPIPQCWIQWLQNLREDPIVRLTDLTDLPNSNGPANIPEGDIRILEKLHGLLLRFDPLKHSHEDNPTKLTPQSQPRKEISKKYSQSIQNKEEATSIDTKIAVVHVAGPAEALHSPESESEKPDGAQIPETLLAPIKFLREMTDILWFKETPGLRDIIISDPMNLIRALRSLIKPNLASYFDKREPSSEGHYIRLTQQGSITKEVFKTIYRARHFTAEETWDFLSQLDIACSLNEEKTEAFIPCLISDEMEERVNNKLAEFKRNGSSLCVEYTFSRGAATVGMFNKLLSKFTQAFNIGETNESIKMAFAQKVEKREIERKKKGKLHHKFARKFKVGGPGDRKKITAGVFGVWGLSEERDIIFLLHEYETVDDNMQKLKSLAHPVHRGIRIFLQQMGSDRVTSKVSDAMKSIHENFADTLGSTLPKLICPTCLYQGKREGFYLMDQNLVIGDIHTATCSTTGHDLPKNMKEVLSGTQGEPTFKEVTAKFEGTRKKVNCQLKRHKRTLIADSGQTEYCSTFPYACVCQSLDSLVPPNHLDHPDHPGNPDHLDQIDDLDHLDHLDSQRTTNNDEQ